VERKCTWVEISATVGTGVASLKKRRPVAHTSYSRSAAGRKRKRVRQLCLFIAIFQNLSANRTALRYKTVILKTCHEQ
jgi:hypothetical protein